VRTKAGGPSSSGPLSRRRHLTNAEPRATRDRRYYRSVNSTVLVALMGILGTLAGALGTRWIDNRQQRRVWLRDQRLEAHHAFLNRVNRLLAAGEAMTSSSPNAANSNGLRTDFREAVAATVDAFNRIELVSSRKTYDLATKILQAVHPERLLQPAEFEAVTRAVGEASRNYREAAKAELRA
jgi:hypothetical protein